MSERHKAGPDARETQIEQAKHSVSGDELMPDKRLDSAANREANAERPDASPAKGRSREGA